MQEKFDYFNVNIRIMQIMRVKGYNKNSLSKLLGISQPALKKIEDNENLPSFKLLFELKQAFPDINPDWLLTGSGEMLLEPKEKVTLISSRPSSISSDVDAPGSVLDKRNEDLIQIIREQQNIITDMQRTISEMSGTINILAKRGDAGTVTGAVSRAASE